MSCLPPSNAGAWDLLSVHGDHTYPAPPPPPPPRHRRGCGARLVKEDVLLYIGSPSQFSLSSIVMVRFGGGGAAGDVGRKCANNARGFAGFA
jgi:hypothetical protein